MSTEPDEVRAAGCVLWRRTPDGGVEIALVHRPKYDDWSHPKGKLEGDESWDEAAVREVREETGMICVLGAGLSTARYRAKGRPKVVHYWAAEALDGVFLPSSEVDQLLWLAPAEAHERITHPANRALLTEALTTVTVS
ncbi:NUDIX hydrolase [Streptomyces sp. B6B3]|uniref:NUDIX hydrolase n=1 Tax=Streptomyces sp. B6B3 TaxID=3153570 RepID=UPI00325F62B4